MSAADRLERRVHRMHRRADGSTKIAWSSMAAAAVEADRLDAVHGVPFSAYQCPGCGSFHVGSVNPADRFQNAHRVNQVEILESGERVAHCTRQENMGTPRRRMVYLRSLFAAVEKKRARGW